jgi:hypothetical protein
MAAILSEDPAERFLFRNARVFPDPKHCVKDVVKDIVDNAEPFPICFSQSTSMLVRQPSNPR